MSSYFCSVHDKSAHFSVIIPAGCCRRSGGGGCGGRVVVVVGGGAADRLVPDPGGGEPDLCESAGVVRHVAAGWEALGGAVVAAGSLAGFTTL